MRTGIAQKGAAARGEAATMRCMRARLPFAVLLAAVAALGPAAASASADNKVICVPITGAPTGCDQAFPTVQDALNQAAALPGFDTVQIAAGSYTAPSGGFTYSD